MIKARAAETLASHDHIFPCPLETSLWTDIGLQCSLATSTPHKHAAPWRIRVSTEGQHYGAGPGGGP